MKDIFYSIKHYVETPAELVHESMCHENLMLLILKIEKEDCEDL